MNDAVIVGIARSPIGKAFKGSLREWRGDDLGALMIRAALDRVPNLDPAEVEDVIVGCAQPAGEQGYNLARAAGLLAGLSAPGTTVNRYCASSVQALRMATHAIRAGEGDVFVVGGIEMVSRYQKGKADRMPDTTNPRFGTDFPDLYLAMGETAERVADQEGVTRDQMDAFAARSQQRAVAAADAGFFEWEIEAVGEVSADDCPRRGTTAAKLGGLKPVFRDDGRVTAGNCCPLNDGAAATVLMSSSRAAELGISPLGRIVSTGVSALAPELMGLGPIASSRSALQRAGLGIGDIDIVEMNEAFAAQVIPCATALEIPDDKLNPHGGAIALGHPYGMTGVRMLATLLNGLRSTGGRYGLETMCVAGGQGMALVVEAY
jgi:acetyl-CoA C-acetyltransferase